MDADIKKLISTMTELIARSEERVDRTNEIIGKAYVLIDKITTEYTNQLSRLQGARDELLKQNSEMLKLLERSNSQLENMNKMYECLLDKFINSFGKNSSENNINVN